MTRTILIDQLRKISTFIYILILLYIILLIFKLQYSWEGIRIIARFYLYVFSFYLIFNFSSLDLKLLKEEYRNIYGKWGDIRLFLVARGFPFLFIYFITIIFTFITYLDKPDWPWRPLLELLNGRFTHTVVYSLILLVILKLRKEPRIAIPLFFGLSIIYFIIYKLIYQFSPTGFAVSAMKIFQVIMVFAFFIYEFFYDKIKILLPVFLSFVIAVILYFMNLGTFISIYKVSSLSSYTKKKSALVMLNLGYKFPIANLEKIIVKHKQYWLLDEFLFYAKHYKYPVSIKQDEWFSLLFVCDYKTSETIFKYLNTNNIDISYNKTIILANRFLIEFGDKLLGSKNFIRYTSQYVGDNFMEITKWYEKSSNTFKIFIIKTMAYSSHKHCIPFLLKIITDVDEKRAHFAYKSLVAITDLDPVKNGAAINSPDSVSTFYMYYKKYLKERDKYKKK